MQIKTICQQSLISRWTATLLLSLSIGMIGPGGMTSRLGADDIENLDEQLEALLLDDLKSELPSEALKEPETGKPPDVGESATAGEDIGTDRENPLSRIGQQMRSVESRLAGGQSPQETEQIQKKIVEDLAALIKQAQQQQQKKKSQSPSSGSSQQTRRSQVKQPKNSQQAKPGDGTNSKKPAKDSTARLGKADATDAERQQMQDRIKELWGHLPERAREQMLQSTSDKFLPKYEVLIEKYFRRLADDSAGGLE